MDNKKTSHYPKNKSFVLTANQTTSVIINQPLIPFDATESTFNLI